MPSSAILHFVQFRPKVLWLVLWLLIVPPAAGAQTTEILPATEPLTWEGDLSARMVAGIDTFLMGELDRSVVERQKLWKRDFSSRAAYEKSIQQNRQRFQKYIGTVDPRVPGTPDLGWLGIRRNRALESRQISDHLGAAADLGSEFTDKIRRGYTAMFTLLNQARSDLRMEVGPLSTAVAAAALARELRVASHAKVVRPKRRRREGGPPPLHSARI